MCVFAWVEIKFVSSRIEVSAGKTLSTADIVARLCNNCKDRMAQCLCHVVNYSGAAAAGVECPPVFFIYLFIGIEEKTPPP